MNVTRVLSVKRALLYGGAAIIGGLTAVWLFRGKRERVVAAALSQVGKSDAEKYWADVMTTMERPRDWCGAFVLWALHRAGLARGWYWEVGKGFLYRLPTTRDPKPGDVAYFTTNQHHAVVTAVRPTEVDLVNGNGTGGKVTRSTAQRANVAGFYSIEPLL